MDHCAEVCLGNRACIEACRADPEYYAEELPGADWPNELLRTVGQPFVEAFETVRVAMTGVLIGAVLVLGAVVYLGRR